MFNRHGLSASDVSHLRCFKALKSCTSGTLRGPSKFLGSGAFTMRVPSLNIEKLSPINTGTP